MPNLTSVGVTAGVPTSGTGTVSTIDALIAAQATLNAVTATANALDINVKSGGNANGQTTMAASAPVTIASDQSAVPVKGSGTAGTANTGVVTVQGIASMTKLLVTPDSVALPANQSVNIAQIAGATTPVGSGVMATAPRVALATDSPGIVTLGQTTKSASVPVTIASDQGINDYPVGATAITASATGTTGATTATLAGTSGKTTYLVGFSIRANATAAATGNATVTGTITGTLNFTQWTAPTASGIGIVEPNISKPIPASATNTGIAVISAAPGTGGVVSVTAWGYQL